MTTTQEPTVVWADCDPEEELDLGDACTPQTTPTPQPVKLPSAYEGRRPLNRAHTKLDELHDRSVFNNTGPRTRLSRDGKSRFKPDPPTPIPFLFQRNPRRRTRPQVDEDGWTTVPSRDYAPCCK